MSMESDKIRPGMIDEDRLDRSRRIQWLDIERIRGARCLVVGAGALGNEVVKDLVLSGVSNITLVDMDHVVGSNLNRCVFFRDGDARDKLKKADIVSSRANELNPEVRIEAHTSKIEEWSWERFRDFDLVFGCLDNIAARLHLNSNAYYAGTPFIDGGTDGFSGKVQVVIPPTTPCLQCAMNRSHYRILEKRHSCTGADVVYHENKIAAEITTTSIVAAIQVKEGLKILSRQKDKCISHVLYYNGLSDRYESFELTIDPECPNHGFDTLSSTTSLSKC